MLMVLMAVSACGGQSGSGPSQQPPVETPSGSVPVTGQWAVARLDLPNGTQLTVSPRKAYVEFTATRASWTDTVNGSTATYTYSHGVLRIGPGLSTLIGYGGNDPVVLALMPAYAAFSKPMTVARDGGYITLSAEGYRFWLAPRG